MSTWGRDFPQPRTRNVEPVLARPEVGGLVGRRVASECDMAAPLRTNDDDILDRFRQIRAVVAGEAMLDVYVHGRVTRLCPDGPFPVLDATDEQQALGGAANVAANLAALGAGTRLVSVVGEDRAGRDLRALATARGIDVAGLVHLPDRVTLSKERLVGDGRIMARVDRGTVGDCQAGEIVRLADRIEQATESCHVMVVSDYGYGVITEDMIQVLDRHRPPVVVVDGKDPVRLGGLRPDAVTSNVGEVMRLLGWDPAEVDDRIGWVRDNATEILAVTGAAAAAVTADVDGVVVVDGGSGVAHLPAKAGGSDPCGAGDTFTATLALGLAAGSSLVQAADLARRASAVVVSRPGTAVCAPADLRGPAPDVLDDEEDLLEVVGRHRAAGRSIAFTNGCFDVIHAGHIASLAEAAGMADVLIVGLNDDDGVRRLKGPGRPVNPFDDRAAVLAGIGVVDHVVGFADDTPLRVLELIRPDVYCKGGDYRGRRIPEIELVESWGGRFEVTTYLSERSTTATVERVRRTAGAGVA